MNATDLHSLTFTILWACAVAVMGVSLRKLNDMPRRSSGWGHAKKFILVMESGGALCVVVYPVFGIEWAVHGAVFMALSTGVSVLVSAVRSSVLGRPFDYGHAFDFDA